MISSLCAPKVSVAIWDIAIWLLLSGLSNAVPGSEFVMGMVPPAEFCLPSAHLKELSGCIAMTDYTAHCKELGTTEEKFNCFCQQEMLSDYYKCQSDVTLCIGMQILDPIFSSLTNDWHTQCSAHFGSLSFTPTTLPVSTLTTTWREKDCSRLALSCTSADYETSKCASTYLPAHTTKYLSCVCREPVYSLFSECQYNGNITCKATSAAESNILGYSFCPYFRSGASSLPMDLTSLIGGPLTSQLPSISQTVPSTIASASPSLTLSPPPVTKPGLPGTSIPTSTQAASTSSKASSATESANYPGTVLFLALFVAGLANLMVQR